MKLHTDFHDYYDTAIGYGIDDKVHYNRFTKEVEKTTKLKKDFPRLYPDVTPLILGFCGEIYPLAEVERRTADYQLIDTYIAYTHEELIAKREEWKINSHRYFHEDNHMKLGTKRFFEEWRMQDDEIFLENKVPVWLYKLQSWNKTLVLNPKLKTYEFFRIKDAHAAFQEISMYLANILVEQKETAPIEDKYRIEQHGFDLKSSFRREKRG